MIALRLWNGRSIETVFKRKRWYLKERGILSGRDFFQISWAWEKAERGSSVRTH